MMANSCCVYASLLFSMNGDDNNDKKMMKLRVNSSIVSVFSYSLINLFLFGKKNK